jgi:hypothetical protein
MKQLENFNIVEKLYFSFVALVILFISSCSVKKDYIDKSSYKYEAEDQELYCTIAKMDSTFFAAYNACDMKKQSEIYADSLEFYHDKGGLMTSKQQILDGTERNICGKVTRELIKGSIEVYPIKDFGAVEIGLHKFYNNQEPDAISKASKFIIMWKYTNQEWRITKVISLH